MDSSAMLQLRLHVHALCLAAMAAGPAPTQQVPHGQDRPPGPALSPAEALARMTVPEGFRVEIFASEPDVINPVTMHFDERGRIWVAESVEYPRREPGPGQDRIKIVEDTDGDGRADKFTVFADGLNIPAGVLVGNGGVYVTNSPDILFLRDTDGDDRADTREVLLTGFGRFDTHELPNTLTWGPDGWIYGLNGVFNPAVVQHQGQEHRFDAALWRLHPRTRHFELFAEGTSNPWGVAWDENGSAFVSACVIDHLYHLAETGYYHRQAGAYPPFTWKIESVVNHKHQKAAYCSLAYYDAEVYPERYRGRLYMGNIHGNCINADRLERKGATYEASGEPDLLSANDAWFMPTAIRLGPDGCLYVLDWYDRYHCYQDANRDPRGIDRLKGRIYRLAYGDAPRAGRLDLARDATARLIELLGHSNLWWRNESKRILAERIAAGGDKDAVARLQVTALDSGAPRRARLHALWTLVSAEDPGAEPRAIDPAFHLKALAADDAVLRAWAVRAAGNARRVAPEVRAAVKGMLRDSSADVRLQVATAARKLFPAGDAVAILLDTLAASAGDPIVPPIVWRNIEPLLESEGAAFAAYAGKDGLAAPAFEPLMGRIAERLLARRDRDMSALASFAVPVLARRDRAPVAAAAALNAIAAAASSGEIGREGVAALRQGLAKPVTEILAGAKDHGLFAPALTLAAAWGDTSAMEEARRRLLDAQARPEARIKVIAPALASRDGAAIDAAITVLKSPAGASEALLREVLAGLGRIDSPAVARGVLDSLGALPAAVKSQAIDVLTQRPAWAATLLEAVDAKRVDKAVITLNQVRRLLAGDDAEIKRRATAIWGQVRAERNPERERVISRMRRMLDSGRGDAWNGQAVFEKTCAKCHVIFGKGVTVGPDVTVNGRETLDALLTNLLDPNLVIGTGYQSWSLVTTTGRVLTGLLVEESPQRIVLKIEGGKDEVIPRGEVQTFEQSAVSLMPEELEKTLTEQEFRDLIAYLRYEEPPPPPVALQKRDGASRLAADNRPGELSVTATLDAAAAPVEILRFAHSNDQRPFIHPLREATTGIVLTALRPADHPWQYGVFTGHARVNGIDFWHERGWIRSRGLESARELGDGVELTARNDWLTASRGGQRVLAEKLRLTVHAPEPRLGGAYAVDIDWELTPDTDLTIDRYDYGGLAFRPAGHSERRHARADGDLGWPWQDMSGRFGDGEKSVIAGVAIFDHPSNPGFPSAWRVDGQGLINPAITARQPLVVARGKTILYRYRLLVHAGHGDKTWLDERFREWSSQ